MLRKMVFAVASVRERSERVTKRIDLSACLDRLIKPAPIIYNRVGLKAKTILFDDIFTGSHHFFLKVHGHDLILAVGLNNFHQLGKIDNNASMADKRRMKFLVGLAQDEPLFFPTFIPALEGKKWVKFSGGLHHTLGLTANGNKQVYSFETDFYLFFST